MSRIGRTVAPLAVPVFRRYLIGASFGSVGHWAMELTVTWAVLTGTGSATAGGLVLACLVVPMILFGVPAGALIDRLGPRTLMIVGQCIAALAVGLGALLAVGGSFPPGLALLVAAVVGACDAFWFVPSQAMVPRLVDSRLMAGAIALAPLQYAAGRFLGGLFAGFGVAAVGTAVGLGGAAIALGVAAMVIVTLPRVRGLKEGGARIRAGDFREVARWLRGSRPALAVFATGMGASLFTYSYMYLMAPLSRSVLGSGAAGLGLITAAGGLGLVLGAFTTEALAKGLGHGRLVLVALGAAGVLCGGIALSGSLAATVVLAGLAAAALTAYSSMTSFLLQVLCPPEMRGRLLAFYTFMFWGIQPVSSISSGLLSDRIGPQAVLAVLGVATVAWVALVAVLAPAVRRLDVDAEGTVVERGGVPRPAGAGS